MKEEKVERRKEEANLEGIIANVAYALFFLVFAT
jgi:hypothetical protein